MKETLLFWTLNIALPVLIIGWIEVYNDTNPPGWFWAKSGDEWGKTAFVNPYWEKRIKVPLPFIKYSSRYHWVMFGIIVPIWLTLSITLTSWLLHYQLIPTGAHWYSARALLSVLTILAACQVGVMGLEDFFYFSYQSCFNWLEPHALRRVLHGDFAWFKDWIPLPFGFKFPGHWVACSAGALLLLYVRQRWIMH